MIGLADRHPNRVRPKGQSQIMALDPGLGRAMATLELSGPLIDELSARLVSNKCTLLLCNCLHEWQTLN
jgi:predicted RNase H-like nuclease (RuvC/YqgF family)